MRKAQVLNKASQQLLADYYAAHRDELLRYVGSRLARFCPAQHERRAEVEHDAEDIVQDVFLRLLTSGHLISPVTIPGLVATISRRLVCDRMRHWAVAYEYEHYLTTRPATADRPQESILSAQLLTERIERSLARLQPDCREVYRMHVYGGMKVSEISQHLGQEYRAVEYRLGMARRHVRQALAAYV
jgi:RNA polymerase sigma-70 factor (ECF subfamily)